MTVTERIRGACSTVLIADGHPLTRDGIRGLLSAEPDLSVCGEADTAAGVRVLARERRPDLVVLDAKLPGGDPFALLSELRSLPQPPRVVMLDGDGRPHGEAERALRLGASAYLGKRAFGDELLRVARDVLKGHTVLGDELIGRLVRRRPRSGGRLQVAR